ncbi:MAG TPA: GxxExxY protein [Pyrinomonadaceae bacterium]|nr:GxxExxY protein [Pyrinomonadaceae bacterium]
MVPNFSHILKEEVYAVIGAALEVYYTLGIGFLEPIYHEALKVELARRNIPFKSEMPLSLYYKDVPLDKKYFADLVCYGQIIVELKVLQGLTNIEVAQLMNYLKITKMHIGLLINFGSNPKLEWKRFVI